MQSGLSLEPGTKARFTIIAQSFVKSARLFLSFSPSDWDKYEYKMVFTVFFVKVLSNCKVIFCSNWIYSLGSYSSFNFKPRSKFHQMIILFRFTSYGVYLEKSRPLDNQCDYIAGFSNVFDFIGLMHFQCTKWSLWYFPNSSCSRNWVYFAFKQI